MYTKIQTANLVHREYTSMQNDTKEQLDREVEENEKEEREKLANLSWDNEILNAVLSETKSFVPKPTAKITVENNKIITDNKFCIIGSQNKAELDFINAYTIKNNWLIKWQLWNMSNATKNNVIDYQMYCFTNVNLSRQLIRSIYKARIEATGSDDYIPLAKLIKENTNGVISKITFFKWYGSNKLLSYRGCYLKDFDTTKELLAQQNIGVAIEDDKNEFIRRERIDCALPKITNIYSFEKDIDIMSAYHWFFTSKKQYNQERERWWLPAWYYNGLKVIFDKIATREFKVNAEDSKRLTKEAKIVYETLSQLFLSSEFEHQLMGQ